MTPVIESSGVQQHYRALAEQYNARANRTCERTYRRLAQRVLRRCKRLLELGSGSSDLLEGLGADFKVACDLSIDMLRAKPRGTLIHCVVNAGERLPYADASFDGVFCINVLEHVGDVSAVVRECARVLQPGGIFLAVTPNGDWEFWLDLAEKWKFKLPEGPHKFLTPSQIRGHVRQAFEILESRTFLVVPAGPPLFARMLDRMTFCSTLGWGFFQYLVAKKPH